METDEFIFANDWVQVGSSSLDALWYEYDQQILHVRFDSGGVYEYLDVPEDVVRDLYEANSLGGYYARFIKGQYECRKG